MTCTDVSPDTKGVLSSAQLAILKSSTIIKRSHIKILTNKDPKTDLCATANKIASKELLLSFIFVFCSLLDKDLSTCLNAAKLKQ